MRILGKLPLLYDVRRDRQRETEPRAAAECVFHPDALVVSLDERLGDGQPEARARIVGPPLEDREDLVAPARADPRAVVSDRDLDGFRPGEPGPEDDGRILRAVPDRVLQ